MAPDEDPDVERIDGDLVAMAIGNVAPPWMSDEAMQDLVAAVMAELAGMEGVVVTRGLDSTPCQRPGRPAVSVEPPARLLGARTAQPG